MESTEGLRTGGKDICIDCSVYIKIDQIQNVGLSSP